MPNDKKERRDKIIAYLLIIVVSAVFFAIAKLIDSKFEKKYHDEDYDEYLEEIYDGVDRYEPW